MATSGPDDEFESLLHDTYPTHGSVNLFGDLGSALGIDWTNGSASLFDHPNTVLRSTAPSPEASPHEEYDQPRAQSQPLIESESESGSAESEFSQSYNSDGDDSLDEYRSSKQQNTSRSKISTKQSSAEKGKRQRRLKKPNFNEPLTEQIARLQAEKDTFQKECNETTLVPPEELDSKARKTWLKNQKNRRSAQLNRFNKAIAELELKLKLENLSQESSTVKRENEALKSITSTQSATPHESLGVNRVRFESLQVEKLRLEAQCKELLDKNRELTSDLKDSQATCATLTEKCEQLTESTAQLQTTCTALTQDKERLVKALKEESELLQAKVAESKKVVEALLRTNEQESTDLEHKITENKSLEEQLQSQIEREKLLQANLGISIAQYQQMESANQALKSEIQRLENNLHQKAHQHAQEIYALQSQGKALATQQQQLRTEVTMYEGIVERNEIDRRSLDEQLARLRQRIHELTQEQHYHERTSHDFQPPYEDRRPPIQHARMLQQSSRVQTYPNAPSYSYRGPRNGQY